MILILSDDQSASGAVELERSLSLILGEMQTFRGTYAGSPFLLVPQAGDELQQAAAKIAGVRAVFPAQELPLLEPLLKSLARLSNEKPSQNIPIMPVSGSCTEIAFQGARGAYSEMAIRQFFGEAAHPVPHAQFKDVFDALMEGTCSIAVLPLENALTGSIHDNYDLLLEYPEIHICGEIYQRINHNLIGLSGTELENVKRVYSHPQGLLQTTVFLDTYPAWERVPFYDTAGSVLHVKESGSTENVAIASSIAAELYGLEILKAGIETNQHNYTRFGILVRNDTQSIPIAHGIEGFKASIAFSLPHRPGSLLQCMQVLGDQDINLTKIESRPIHGRPWEYMFYLDMDITTGLDRFYIAITMIQGFAEHLRVLGIYPRALTQI